jgi:hypothetical protein
VRGFALVNDAEGILGFALNCKGTCLPAWRARVPGGPGFEPVVSGDIVLSAASFGSDLFAFPLNCAKTFCEPSWVGHFDEGVGFQPTVIDDKVFVATSLGDTLAAFPIPCTAACSPAWTAPLGDSITFQPVGNAGLVFISGISGVTAFPTDCSDPCAPVFGWGLPTRSPQASPVLADGTMLVFGNEKIYGLRLGAAVPNAQRATTNVWILPLAVLFAAAGLVLSATWRRRRLRL